MSVYHFTPRSRNRHLRRLHGEEARRVRARLQPIGAVAQRVIHGLREFRP